MILAPGNYYNQNNNSLYQSPYTNQNYLNNDPNNNNKRSNEPPEKKALSIFIIIGIILIVVLALIFITLMIIFSINPCIATKCHKLASICINRHPFYAQCICDRGYAGNGKTVCEPCGLTYFRPNVMRIVGGSNAIPSSWPFAVFIRQNYRGVFKINGIRLMINVNFNCGGTLINHKTVLTAAHCIHRNFEYKTKFSNIPVNLTIKPNKWYPNLESTMKVFVGAHNIKSLGYAQRVIVKKIIQNEKFNENTLKNDFAILKLEDYVRPSRRTQFACLPYNISPSYPRANTQAYIIGWGKINDNGPISPILKNAAISVFDGSYCRNVASSLPKNWNEQICAGTLDASVDSCQGDSGNGMFVMENVTLSLNNRLFVAGIVSYGDSCATKNKPAIYVRVSYWLDWIRKHSDF